MRLNLVRAFFRRDDGNVAIIGAITMSVLVGFVALVAEFGHGLLNKAQYQRVADLSSYAGALAYNTSGSTTTMTAAAQSVAALNGIDPTTVTAALVASPRTAGSNAVSVSIARSNTLLLAPLLGYGASLPVRSSSSAEMNIPPSACILALSAGGTGVTLSGGTAVTAAACSVSSNATISVPCGTSIMAKSVSYNSAAAPSQPCNGIKNATGGAASISRTATADPLATNAGVLAATGHMSYVTTFSSPAAPGAVTPAAVSVSGGLPISFDWLGLAAILSSLPSGCLVGGLLGSYTVTCGSASSYTFGAITVLGGVTVAFNTGGSASTTYNFNGGITNQGSLTFGPGTFNISGTINNASTIKFGSGTVNIGGALTGSGTTTFGAGTVNVGGALSAAGTTTFGAGTINVGGALTTAGTTTFGAGTINVGGAVTTAGTTTFGAGTVNIRQGLFVSGGSTTTFGAGTFTIGQGGACNGGSSYSLCNLGTTLTFAGPSTFAFASGIYNNGGSTLTLGSGTTNSFQVGAASNGDAVDLGGASKTVFADALGGASLFQLNGNLNVTSGGGSCLTLSAAAQHDIDGYLSAAGGTMLGAGVYTVNGYIVFGAGGGGDVTCNGVTVGVTGTGVTLVTSGASAATGSPCAGQSFCVAAGYNNTNLVAPTSGTTANIVVIGPIAAARTSGAMFTSGASNTTLSGAFYYPNGPVSLGGAASVGGGAGQCLELIGTQVTLGGGSAAASMCISAASSAQAVRLVQ